MLFLILTILSSLSISLILKFNETRQGNRLVVAGANYLTAMILGLLLSEATPVLGVSNTLFGLLVGGGFMAGFMLLMHGIKHLGLAVPISIARITMISPVVGALLIYGEEPTTPQMGGILAGAASFLLFGAAQRRREKDERVDLTGLLLLVGIFVVMSLNDFAMKVVQEAGIDKGAFLFYVFGSAAAICWGIVAVRRLPVRRAELLLGAFLGVPNYFSSYFLILALRDLPAAVVFPAAAAGVLLSAALAAVLIWQERPPRLAWIGIGLAAASTILVSL